MIDPACDLDRQDDTVVLSKDFRVSDPFAPMQVTIAELGSCAPTVALYRFINCEETEYMELNGAEMAALIAAYTAKHSSPVRTGIDIAHALHQAKNSIELGGHKGCPERVVNAVLQDLVRELATLLLPPEQQEQIEHFLDHCVQHALEQAAQGGQRI